MSMRNLIQRSMILSALNRKRCKRRWRKLNPENYTIMGKNLFNPSKVFVGYGTYGELNVYQFENTCSDLKIGRYCSIAPEVSFLVDGEHRYDSLSTYPFKARILGVLGDTKSKGDIVIEDDVWIGFRATILSGVHIGQGAIIAAGAVVVADVPPYAIVGGTPAKVIRFRFEAEYIKELIKTDYSKIDEEFVKKHMTQLCNKITEIDQLDFLPQNGGHSNENNA